MPNIYPPLWEVAMSAVQNKNFLQLREIVFVKTPITAKKDKDIKKLEGALAVIQYKDYQQLEEIDIYPFLWEHATSAIQNKDFKQLVEIVSVMGLTGNISRG